MTTPDFREPDFRRPGDITARHQMRVRRYESHVKAIWCTCGWALPEPRKLVFKADVEAIWREHLDPPP